MEQKNDLNNFSVSTKMAVRFVRDFQIESLKRMLPLTPFILIWSIFIERWLKSHCPKPIDPFVAPMLAAFFFIYGMVASNKALKRALENFLIKNLNRKEES